MFKLLRSRKPVILWSTAGLLLAVALGVSTWLLIGHHHRLEASKVTPHPISSPVVPSATPPAPNPAQVPADTTLLKTFTVPFANGLITNEYANFNSDDAAAARSNDWQMTSGSLLAKDGFFWTGNPDSCDSGPNAGSTNCTDSNVFRLNSTRQFGGNVKVNIALRQLQEIHSSSCNVGDNCWHGTHLWLRYQSQYNLYYASLNRADGQVVLKRKVPCGNDNSGTYFVLGSYVKHNFTTGAWNNYSVTIQTNANGSVTLKLYDDSVSTTSPVVIGTDSGGTNPNWSPSCTVPGAYPSAQYSPITAAGAIGVRGDFANFEFTNFNVHSF